MNERHPVDDLFARALRDAEAEPPAGAWAGIARARSGGMLGRLRRYGGWLALLLLLGGGASMAVLHSGPAAVAQQGSTPTPTPAVPAAAAHAPAPGATNAVSASSDLRNGSMPTTAPSETPGRHAEHVHAPLGEGRKVSSERQEVSALAAAGTATASDEPLGKAAPETGSRAYVPQPSPTVAFSTGTHLEQATGDRPDAEVDVYREEMVSVGRVQPRALRPWAAPWPAEPRKPQALAAWERPHAWWVAVSAGSYQRTRTWHGDDDRLIGALQGTEVPHSSQVFGVLSGVEWRGGWSLAVGVECAAGRYDFRHRDRWRTRHDSLVQHVVTFNSMVVGNFMDTVSTVEETNRSVAGVNRYTSVYIPVEVAWHRGWRRWHYGIRLGAGVEFSAMRSGNTLETGLEGERSVDLAVAGRRTAVQLTGGPALDFGYALTERLGLWATPSWSTTLLSLRPTDGSPYATREQIGLRVRLAYTLRPKP